MKNGIGTEKTSASPFLSLSCSSRVKLFLLLPVIKFHFPTDHVQWNKLVKPLPRLCSLDVNSQLVSFFSLLFFPRWPRIRRDPIHFSLVVIPALLNNVITRFLELLLIFSVYLAFFIPGENLFRLPLATLPPPVMTVMSLCCPFLLTLSFIVSGLFQWCPGLL